MTCIMLQEKPSDFRKTERNEGLMRDDNATMIFRPAYRTPKLFIFYDDHVEEHLIRPGMTIGRGNEESKPDLVIPKKTVSRLHGEIFLDSGIYFYRNLSASNGTVVNGRKMEKGEVCRLSDGERLIIHPLYDRNRGRDILILISFSYLDQTSWKVLRLDDNIEAVHVGRDEKLQIEDERVSRHHACFLNVNGKWAILDLKSKNGVLLNQKKIQEAAYIATEDVIGISGYLFVLMGSNLFYQVSRAGAKKKTDADFRRQPNEGIRKEPVLSIDIEEKNVWNRWKRKTLLKNIKLDVRAGEFVLILGGSGAGKTTFINAVMGYEKAKGEIRYKNMDIYDQYRKMKYEIGYVPQQITMRRDDIVFETLMDAAEMRMPSSVPHRDRLQKVKEVIQVLGLQEQSDQQVQKLSGGQQKRVSLAIEYLGNPSLFFLDEPDSGIDESESMEIMKNLRTIADEKKIVMLISHSPDRVENLLDKVIVLTKSKKDGSGHLAFFGTPAEATRFFGVSKLSEIIKRINPVSEGGEGKADQFIQKYKEYAGK